MSNDTKPSIVAPLGGVVVGLAVFLGANFTAGRAIVPTVESVTNPSHGLSQPVYASEQVQAAGGDAAGTGGAYQTVCQSCHQADGKGVQGAFPPLAGSDWLTQDPETPIRIVLLGLNGEITVNGQTFNSTMPPPAGMTDEQVAEAVSYARTNFGNDASEVDVELVKKVRASLEGRTEMWTAAELVALRPAAGEGAGGEATEGEDAVEGGVDEGEGAAEGEATEAEGEATEAEGAADEAAAEAEAPAEDEAPAEQEPAAAPEEAAE